MMLVALAVLTVAFEGYTSDDDDADDGGSHALTARQGLIIGAMFLCE